MSALLSDNGVDTVRFRWREDEAVYHLFKRRPDGYMLGARGGEIFDQTELGRIGVFPDGLVYLEGRAEAIRNRDKTNHNLGRVSDLQITERVAAEFVREQGADVGEAESARLGRLDLAGELRFADGNDGSAFLHSLKGLDVPWCKARVDGLKGSHIENVSFHGTRGKTIYLRAYDKGIEAETDPAGIRIRMERQKRFRKSREPFPNEITDSVAQVFYLGREFEKLAQLPTATVCDLPDALVTLCERAETYAQLERLAGYLTVGHYVDYERTTRWRRESELRSLGIFVDPTQVERLEVPVGQYLQTLAAAWAS